MRAAGAGKPFIAGLMLLGMFFSGPGKEFTPKTADSGWDPIAGINDGVNGAQDQLRIVRFGSQPLAVPTHSVTILLGRDRILASQLKKNGLALQVRNFAKGEDLNREFAAGGLDMGVLGDFPAIEAAAQFDVLIPAYVKQNFSTIISREHLPLEKLNGKRIAFSPGSTAHYTLHRALETVGLNEKDIIAAAIPVNKMPEALHKGEIDAFSAWEPTPAIALARFGYFKIIYRHINTSYFYLSQSWLRAHRESAAHIVAAIIRAVRWLRSERENLIKTAQWSLYAYDAIQPIQNVISVEKMAQLIEEGLSQLGSAPIIPTEFLSPNGCIRQEFLFMKKNGKLPAGTKWEKIAGAFDRSIMIEILKNPGEYRVDHFDYEEGKAP